MLIVFSCYQSPQSCNGLLSLSRSIENGKDQNFLKFEQEISLPETTAVDKSLCIGSSEGILFTIPKEIPKEMSTVNPLTGAHLPLPSTFALRTDSSSLSLNSGKSILSPSHDMVILSHLYEVHIARLGAPQRFWIYCPMLEDLLGSRPISWETPFSTTMGTSQWMRDKCHHVSHQNNHHFYPHLQIGRRGRRKWNSLNHHSKIKEKRTKKRR